MTDAVCADACCGERVLVPSAAAQSGPVDEAVAEHAAAVPGRGAAGCAGGAGHDFGFHAARGVCSTGAGRPWL